ncbi:MAG: IS200/IS605 family transposase [Chthoniobacterales bacterium]|nr:IS200/IS605 family transposase [Chthoniobacterales bacterium]MCX7713010.1 IS200/IS605 family transposase [Chthoniobacterales bacterium]
MRCELSKLYVHVVFSTRLREPCLQMEWLRELHQGMARILEQMGCPSIRTGGVSDHVHSLFILSREMSLVEAIRRLKQRSAGLIRKRYGMTHFQWQEGYGAFSVSASKVREVSEYIFRQEEHHRQRTFQEEMRLFFRRYRVDFEEEEVWK